MDLQLEARRFTTTAAVAKEAVHLLSDPGCNVIVLANAESFTDIARELNSQVSEGRVEVVRLYD